VELQHDISSHQFHPFRFRTLNQWNECADAEIPDNYTVNALPAQQQQLPHPLSLLKNSNSLIQIIYLTHADGYPDSI